MEKRIYETTFIMDPQMEPDKINEFTKKIEGIITESQGVIRKIEHWGKKRLAYEIRKRPYGYYVYILFEAPGSAVEKIEKEYKLNESVLRYLTVKLDKKALKQMKLREEQMKAERAPGEVPSHEEPAEKEPAEEPAGTH